MIRVTRESAWYPQLFRGIPNEPSTLYYEGNPALVHEPCIAIIGTREPSVVGWRTAYHLSRYYARNGYTIVSGLAAGIDTAAHTGALSVGGNTIAVLATTLDMDDIYPKSNRVLAKQIAKGGLLLTEYHDRKILPRRFFERDRLQSGLSHIVIPVQAGASSGTLHTVRAALSQGRRVCVPYPCQSDLEQYPEKYAGILSLIEGGQVTAFHSDELDHIL